MSEGREEPPQGGRGLLSGLLAPLRLPERAVDALVELSESARTMRSELIRVREQTEPLRGLMPAVERIIRQTAMVPDVNRTVERIREQAEPLAQLLPALDSLEERLSTEIHSLHDTIVGLEGEESHLNKSVGRLIDELQSMHETVAGLQDDVQRITDRLPDPDRGPLEKAKDVFTGSGE